MHGPGTIASATKFLAVESMHPTIVYLQVGVPAVAVESKLTAAGSTQPRTMTMHEPSSTLASGLKFVAALDVQPGSAEGGAGAGGNDGGNPTILRMKTRRLHNLALWLVPEVCNMLTPHSLFPCGFPAVPQDMPSASTRQWVPQW